MDTSYEDVRIEQAQKNQRTGRGTNSTEPSEVPVVGLLTTRCNTKEFCVVPHAFLVIITVNTDVFRKTLFTDWRQTVSSVKAEQAVCLMP